MGRVFDALKRANATEKSGAPKKGPTPDSTHSDGVRASTILPSAREIEEQLFAGSSILKTPGGSVQDSASTAHTADAPDGSALPGGIASRAAGATLDAAGATRATGFVSHDISVARVEPHLVAVTQPRSAYCELF